MNEVLSYSDETEQDYGFAERVAAQKNHLLGRIAAGSVSHLELLCVSPTDTPEVINTALNQLEQSRSITKIVSDLSDEQHIVIGYELA